MTIIKSTNNSNGGSSIPSASSTTYTPINPSQWPIVPTTVKQGLDTLQDEVFTITQTLETQETLYPAILSGSQYNITTPLALTTLMVGDTFILNPSNICPANSTLAIDNAIAIPILTPNGVPVQAGFIIPNKALKVIIVNNGGLKAQIITDNSQANIPQQSGIYAQINSPTNTPKFTLTSSGGFVLNYTALSLYWIPTGSSYNFAAGSITMTGVTLPIAGKQIYVFTYISIVANSLTWQFSTTPLSSGDNVIQIAQFFISNTAILPLTIFVAPKLCATPRTNTKYLYTGSITPTTTLLSLSNTSGSLIGMGANYIHSDTFTDELVISSNIAPANLYIGTQIGINSTPVTTIPKQYDVGGVAVALTSTSFGVMSIFTGISSTGIIFNIVFLGNAQYTTFALAFNAMSNPASWTYPISQNGLRLVGRAIVSGGANTTWNTTTNINQLFPITVGQSGGGVVPLASIGIQNNGGSTTSNQNILNIGTGLTSIANNPISGTSTITSVAATTILEGDVTTTNQSFAGLKTFISGTSVGGSGINITGGNLILNPGTNIQIQQMPPNAALVVGADPQNIVTGMIGSPGQLLTANSNSPPSFQTLNQTLTALNHTSGSNSNLTISSSQGGTMSYQIIGLDQKTIGNVNFYYLYFNVYNINNWTAVDGTIQLLGGQTMNMTQIGQIATSYLPSTGQPNSVTINGVPAFVLGIVWKSASVYLQNSVQLQLFIDSNGKLFMENNGAALGQLICPGITYY